MRTPRGYLVKETSQLCYDAVSMRRGGGGEGEGGREEKDEGGGKGGGGE